MTDIVFFIFYLYYSSRFIRPQTIVVVFLYLLCIAIILDIEGNHVSFMCHNNIYQIKNAIIEKKTNPQL